MILTMIGRQDRLELELRMSNMSVEELHMTQRYDGQMLTLKTKIDHFGFLELSLYAPECWVDYKLDREQAHLLYIYLKEKLRVG